MNILSRLISIGARKFEEYPSEREPAVRMILLNSIRLGCAILGGKKTRALVDEALRGVAQ